MAKEKKIRCNGRHCDGAHRVQNGDLLCLYLPGPLAPAEDGPLYLRARQELSVVFEDSQLLVADKPAGLLTLDEEKRQPDTLENRVLRYLAAGGGLQPGAGFTPAPCHRLDAGTSGLVLVAKTALCRDALQGAIRRHRLKKQYLCVVLGRPSPPQATLKGYLLKDAARSRVRVTGGPQPGALQIATGYSTLAASGRFSLLQVEPVTGRTHQIRAHLASIGCPLLGDDKYGDRALNRQLRTRYQLLCAHRLALPRFEEKALAALSGRSFCAAEPWFYAAVQNHTLK